MKHPMQFNHRNVQAGYALRDFFKKGQHRAKRMAALEASCDLWLVSAGYCIDAPDLIPAGSTRGFRGHAIESTVDRNDQSKGTTP